MIANKDHTRKTIDEFCKKLSLRESNACIRYLGNSVDYSDVVASQEKLCSILFNNALADNMMDMGQLLIGNKIQELKDFINKNIIPESRVSWIKEIKSEELFFFYFILFDYEKTHFPILKPKITPISNYDFVNLFSQAGDYNFQVKDRDYADRIISFLDSTICPVESKLALLNNIRSIYHTYLSEDLLSNWLNNRDAEKIYWTESYLKQKYSFNIEQWLNLNQKIYRIKAFIFFLFYGDSTSDKELFKIKIKKAWSQAKFRGLDNRKKPFNIVMDKSIKDKLDFLSNSQNRPRNEIVEELINTAYNELNK
ncbi:hypothetical protein [Shewanella litorisediminis]|uniref:Uncharacterized protein n=1 Tax=Shewanella litorisediminis TaxID=1173586 RepID=A0ABX7G072_9GAMM|nr:hypothetical protein [Shewanella litorisediminis]MCL2918272.1 hypothetical protein [Shewanella litorisediminis]QRH00679.1 hypothetical protein JQC75_12405 [Shewanella litorisediminis]